MIEEFTIEKPKIEEFAIEEFPVDSAPKTTPIEEFAIEEFPINETTPGGLVVESAGDSLKEWAGKRGKQIKEGKYIRGIGGGALDVLATVGSRPAQAITAGLQAKRTGKGGFFETAGKYLASGDIRDVEGKDISDVTYGWTPTTVPQQVLKSGLNIARDMLGVGGAVKGVGMLSKLAKAKGAGEAIYKTGQAISGAENVFNPLISKAVTPLIKGAGGAISKGVDALPDTAKGYLRGIVSPKIGISEDVLRLGEKVKGTKNYFSNLTNEVVENAKQSTQGFTWTYKGDKKAANAMADLNAGLRVTGAVPMNKLQGADRVAREAYVARNQAILDKFKEFKERLKAVGVENGMDDTFRRVMPSSEHYQKMYAIDPRTTKPSEVKLIVKNIDTAIAKYAGRLKSNTADDVAKAKAAIESLKRMRKAHLSTNPQAVEAQLDLEDLLGGSVPYAKSGKSFGFAGSSVKGRVIPDFLSDVYMPRRDLQSVRAGMHAQDETMARLEAQVQLIERDPTKAYGYIGSKGKMVDDHFRAWEEAGIFQGVKDVVPTIKTDPDVYEYVSQLLGGKNKIEEKLGWLSDNPLAKWQKSTWKNFMLRNPGSIIRNHVDTYLARGAQHGVEMSEYMKGVKTALSISKGKGASVPSNLKNIYYRMNGQMSTQSTLPLTDIADIKAIKLPDGTEASIPSKMTKGIANAWDELGHHFRASDDGLRIAMFNTKVSQFANKPLNEAVKNKAAVEQAMAYVRDNTVVYDELPTLAKFMQLMNPFFSFNFRSPKQYLKAFAANPTFTGKTKKAFERESERNLEQVSPQMRSIFEASKNPLADFISPFGGDVFLGEGRDSVTKGPTIEKINMAPYSFAQRRQTPENFAPNTGMQVKDVALQMSGMPMFGKGGGQTLAPVTPMLAIQNILSEPDKLKGILKVATPRVLSQLAATVPIPVYEKLGGVGMKIAGATYPYRGGTPGRAALSMGGISTQQVPVADVYNQAVKAIDLQKQEEIANIEKEIEHLYTDYNGAEATAYRERELARRIPKFDKQLQRILKAIK